MQEVHVVGTVSPDRGLTGKACEAAYPVVGLSLRLSSSMGRTSQMCLKCRCRACTLRGTAGCVTCFYWSRSFEVRVGEGGGLEKEYGRTMQIPAWFGRYTVATVS